MSDKAKSAWPTADQISTALQGEATPAPAAETPEAPAPSSEVTTEVPAPETPAPVAVSDPAPEAPLSITDKSIVIDPADGQAKTWGEIKNERLRHADYTRKRMEDADARREFEAYKAKALAEIEAIKAQQKTAELPDLPEDDPFAIRIKAIEQAQIARQAEEQQRIQAAEQHQIESARLKLDALVEKVSSEFKLDEREMNFVGMETARRINAGEQVTLDVVAKEFDAYRAALRAEGERQFKEKHRVAVAAAPETAPVQGTAAPALTPKSPGFAEAFARSIGVPL